MTLSEVKSLLSGLEDLSFRLGDGTAIPAHFHVTEIGQLRKNFIDCGGTVRSEDKISFQLWSAEDQDHRLKPRKLANIIALAERRLGIGDHEVEVDYQSDTIGKYALDFDGGHFILRPLKTDCLAKENCGIPETYPHKNTSNETTCCSPSAGCC